ncbi:hypothetical protein F2Q69_00009606 [Brassica cretica]|uniref:Uncharacterized protein n=1 Tax=Brassica cretica TaxID=69181 RepID=A0A8S9NQE6_BRACR|nr:hypothetical protein F2Q69_00009606 [Brassica cretica]
MWVSDQKRLAPALQTKDDRLCPSKGVRLFSKERLALRLDANRGHETPRLCRDLPPSMKTQPLSRDIPRRRRLRLYSLPRWISSAVCEEIKSKEANEEGSSKQRSAYAGALNPCNKQGFPASRIIPLDPVRQRSTSPGRALPGLDRTQYRFGVQKR